MVCEFHLNKAIKKKNHLQRPMSGSGEAEINKKLLPFHGFTVHSKRTGNKWPVRRQRLGRGALVIMGTAEAKAEAGARPPAGLLQLPHALNSSVPLSEASRPGTPSTSLESRTRGRALSLLLLREPQARHAHLPSVHKKGAPDISEGLKMATADLAMPASPEAPRTASVPTGEVYKPQARAL